MDDGGQTSPIDALEAEVCGTGADATLLCRYVYRQTGDELLASAADVVGTMLRIVAIIIVAYVITRLLRRFVTRFAGAMEQRIEQRLTRAQRRGAITQTQRFRARRLQRLNAIVGVMRGVVAAVIWVTALLAVLAILDVRLQPILAGAGLIGVVVGFGAQQLVRDVIAGIAMLVEDQYGVGDWIEVDGVFGEVERVGLRSTAFRDVDGVVHHVLNGSMQRVGNLSQHWARATFDVPVALDADIPTAKAVIHEVASSLAKDPVWGPDVIGPPEIWGVQHLGPDGVKIRLVIPTRPLRNWDIARQLRERIKIAFDAASIRMPSQLVDLAGQHTGYAVLTRDVTDDDRTLARQVRDTAHSDPAPDGETPARDDSTVRLPDRDHTEELRLERGPQPRPD